MLSFRNDMAESGISGYKCGICLLPISNPKLLSCHHSFCLNCLEENYRVTNTNRLRCPLCRAITNIPADGVKVLQNNFYISSEKATVPERVQGLDCDICQKNASEIQKCLQCDQYLCEVCAHAHLVMTASRTHKLLTVSAKDAKEIGKIKRRSFCKNHPNKEIEVICKVCNELMCCVCKLTKHETHICRDIATEADEKRVEINELIKYYENQLIEQGDINASMNARAQRKQQFFSERLSSMKREKEAVIRNIHETFEEFECRMQGLFEEFKDTSSAISDDQIRVEYINKKNVKQCKRVINSGDDVIMLQTFEHMMNGLSAIEIVQPPDVSDDEINKNFDICENWLQDVKDRNSFKVDFYGRINSSTHESDSTQKSASKVKCSKADGFKNKLPETHSTTIVGRNKSKKRNKCLPTQPSSMVGYGAYQQQHTIHAKNMHQSSNRYGGYEPDYADF